MGLWTQLARRSPLVVAAACWYLLFCLLMPIGALRGPGGPEVLDVLFMSAYLWPYPLVLSLQHWFNTDSGLNVLVLVFILMLDVLGLGLVLVCTAMVQRRFGPGNPKGWRLFAWSVWIWYPPLLLLQAVVWGIVLALGYPVGE